MSWSHDDLIRIDMHPTHISVDRARGRRAFVIINASATSLQLGRAFLYSINSTTERLRNIKKYAADRKHAALIPTPGSYAEDPQARHILRAMEQKQVRVFEILRNGPIRLGAKLTSVAHAEVSLSQWRDLVKSEETEESVETVETPDAEEKLSEISEGLIDSVSTSPLDELLPPRDVEPVIVEPDAPTEEALTALGVPDLGDDPEFVEHAAHAVGDDTNGEPADIVEGPADIVEPEAAEETAEETVEDFSDVDWDRLEDLKISELRDLGKRFDPVINARSSADLIEQLTEAAIEKDLI